MPPLRKRSHSNDEYPSSPTLEENVCETIASSSSEVKNEAKKPKIDTKTLNDSSDEEELFLPKKEHYEEVISSRTTDRISSELDQIGSVPELKTQFDANNYIGSNVLCVDIGSSFSKACYFTVKEKVKVHLCF